MSKERFEKLLQAHNEVIRLKTELEEAEDRLKEASDEVMRYERYGYHVFEGYLFTVETDRRLVGIEGDVYFPGDED